MILITSPSWLPWEGRRGRRGEWWPPGARRWRTGASRRARCPRPWCCCRLERWLTPTITSLQLTSYLRAPCCPPRSSWSLRRWPGRRDTPGQAGLRESLSRPDPHNQSSEILLSSEESKSNQFKSLPQPLLLVLISSLIFGKVFTSIWKLLSWYYERINFLG